MSDIIQEIQNDPDRNFFISASAGTGKTYTLTQYYISILNKTTNPDIVENILAVTFTNKAANEMRERILDEVYKKIEEKVNQEYWEQVKINLSRAWITTIDSFCSKLLRENNIAVGIDPNFGLISDFKQDREIDRTINNTLKMVFELYEDKPVDDLKTISEKRKDTIKVIFDEFKNDNERFKSTLKFLLKNYKLEELQKALKVVIKNWRFEMNNISLFEKLELANLENSGVFNDSLWLFKNLAIIAKEIYESLTIDQFQYDFKGVLEKAIEILDIDFIRTKYQNRFRYIIVDEYQDTNYLQKLLFDKLHTEKNFLFYVGDRKQSIYRFRGADVSVFTKTSLEFQKDPEKYITSSISTNRRSEREIVEFANAISKEVLFNEIFMKKYDPLDHELIESMIFNDGDRCNFEVPINENVEIIPKLTYDDKYRIKYVYGIKSDDKIRDEIETMAKVIKKLIGQDFSVRTRKDGKILHQTEQVKPKHIAILLRKLVGYEDVIKEVFSRYDIPYYIVGSKSFYNRPEVQAVFTALNAIQNPYNDFQFTKYLFSLMAGISLEEFDKVSEKRKELRKINKKESLYEAFGTIKDEFSDRIVKAYDLLTKYKELKYYLKPTVILKGIIEESNYIARLSALGEQAESAVSNIKKLINDAEQYNKISSSFGELVRLLKKSADFDEEEAAIEDENSNSVKIMTTHKSKGLEFPIVILGGLNDALEKTGMENALEFSIPDTDGNRYYILKKLFKEELTDSTDINLKRFGDNDYLTYTEAHRIAYVAVTRAKEMIIPVILQSEEDEGKKVSRKETYGTFFSIISEKYESVDHINIDEIESKEQFKAEIHDIINLKEVPAENLRDLSDMSYKQYIAPTFLIREDKEKENDFEVTGENKINKKFEYDIEKIFSNNEKLSRGKTLHGYLESINSIADIKYLEENGKLIKGFSEIKPVKEMFDGNIIRTEWRLVKNVVIGNMDYMLFGIPDRVVMKDFEGERRITVFDYKYSKLANKVNIEEYKFQMRFYMYLLSDFGKIEKGYILSIENGHYETVDYPENFEEQIKKKIESL